MENIETKIGHHFKRIRENLGMSQENLAKAIGLSRPSVSQIENGERKISAAELIAFSKVFNCSIDFLLDLESPPEVFLEKTKKAKEPNTPSIRISVPQENLGKFKETLLYILNKVGSKPNIGETVIYKLLYFCDFDYYEKYEEQLIGATYQKNHYGPTPIEFKTVVDRMIQEKDLMKVNDEYFNYPRTKYLPLRAPNLRILKASEIEIINKVLDRLSDMNANEISNYSHQDIPWLTAEKGQNIDYESVFYRTPPYSVREYQETEEGESEDG